MLALAIPEAHADNADITYYSYTLQWTAPGDDGTIGRARAYDLRYSVTPITESNWHDALAFPGMPVPSNPGVRESFTIFGLDARNNYYVAVKTIDDAGNSSGISNVLIVHSPLPVASPGDTSHIALSMPWPNPASAQVRFAYDLPQSGNIQIDALDVAGRRVKSLASGRHSAGRALVQWDLADERGGHVAPGIYMIRARLIDQVVTRRLVVER